MKKILATAAILTAFMPLAAQETYENARTAQQDLNGTARYVGMGGAMEALGADLSTISSNPAGIGLFRRSNISISAGLVSQSGVSDAVGGHKTNLSFDQAGGVYSVRTGETSFLNFAFNYHKSRNFNQILSAAADLDHASMNKLTYAKAKNGLLYRQHDGVGALAGYQVSSLSNPYIQCNLLDEMLTRGLNYDEQRVDANGNPLLWVYDDANHYQFDRAQKGYVSDFDFNISGNINNRLYLGVTLGLHHVSYKHYSEYTETIPYDYSDPSAGNYLLTVGDNREITGSGFDVKAGVIFRPVANSPFRVGLYVSTPTFYELHTKGHAFITDGPYTMTSNAEGISEARARSDYKFKLYTPWKFGASLGHTIGNNIALGATYEYADYTALDTRYITNEYYDYDGYGNNSESDQVMNSHTERTLKGVHMLKVGAEYKPIKNVALRIGYNYVSPMYKKDGYKNGALDSDASYISTATDFTNWEDTHRLTLGAGYTYQKFNVSLAYQYSTTKGTFYPFMSYEEAPGAPDNNIADGVSVKNNRHQLLLTLGYSF